MSVVSIALVLMSSNIVLSQVTTDYLTVYLWDSTNKERYADARIRIYEGSQPSVVGGEQAWRNLLFDTDTEIGPGIPTSHRTGDCDFGRFLSSIELSIPQRGKLDSHMPSGYSPELPSRNPGKFAPLQGDFLWRWFQPTIRLYSPDPHGACLQLESLRLCPFDRNIYSIRY